MPTHLQYSPEIYQPLEDNSVSAEGRARSFANLNPRSSYNDICGRKIVPSGRSARIVGGGVANYAEWPWTVSCLPVIQVYCFLRFHCASTRGVSSSTNVELLFSPTVGSSLPLTASKSVSNSKKINYQILYHIFTGHSTKQPSREGWRVSCAEHKRAGRACGSKDQEGRHSPQLRQDNI